MAQRRVPLTGVFELPKLRDFMDTKVHTVPPDMPIMEAIGTLLSNHVTGAPVVDGEGKLVGMLTELNCMRLATGGARAHAPGGTVADYMTTDVVVVPPDMDVYYAAGLFMKHDFRRFVVVENDELIGAVTRFDLLRVIHANLS